MSITANTSIIHIHIFNVFHISACVNDDSSVDKYGYTCSQINYIVYPEDCGYYDTENFTASVQCCACGGGNVTGEVE